MPPRRNLRAVEEGNPGHRKPRAKVEARKAMPVEPDWSSLFPGDGIDELRCVATCKAEWSAVTPVLFGMGLLAGPLDVEALKDYAICVARIDQCERVISELGLVVPGRDATMVRNPALTVAAQYRTQLRALIVHLGLSPNARDGMKTPEGAAGPENDPFSA